MLRQTFQNNLKLKNSDTEVESLGDCNIDNPKAKRTNNFELVNQKVVINPFIDKGTDDLASNTSFEISSPTQKIFFDPTKIRAGIVTCGGICPGLNNVIRSIVLSLNHSYGCKKIYGFKYGLQGFIPEYNHKVLELTPEIVSNIHDSGGSILGTSRGPQPVKRIVETLVKLKIDQLYFIGGDGSLKAAEIIYKEIKRQGLKIALVCVPKTIDNDIPFSSETFGFDTAVEIAANAIKTAHVEAKSNPYGIGLVKLMGRYSGFIAALASLSQRDVNFVLIPEYDFDLEGDKGLLANLKQRMLDRKHAVIVVAEGAGQKLFVDKSKKKLADASGNINFKDIGLLLKDKINGYFKEQKVAINLKYIDPSYLIRSVSCNNHDKVFAATLGHNAVHTAMTGKTNCMVAIWHGVYCNVPLNLVNKRVKRLSLSGRIWVNVLESTGQPDLRNEE